MIAFFAWISAGMERLVGRAQETRLAHRPDRLPGGARARSTRLIGCCTWSPEMALSDTAIRVLSEAAQHPLRLATPPNKLPAVAARAVLNNMLKQGYVEQCKAPEGFAGFCWHQQDGTRPTVRISAAGMAAIGATLVASATSTNSKGASIVVELADTAREPGSAPLAPPLGPEALVTPADGYRGRPAPLPARHPPSDR
jgi:hypothetical protein